MRASITFSAEKRSVIGGYEVPKEESLSDFGMWMTKDDFQIVGIRHDVMESLKSAVWYSIALDPKIFRCFCSLHVCLRCSFGVFVISSFICCRAGEVGFLELRSPHALIYSNSSAWTVY